MPRRILIADDNATFRKALRQLLEGVDHWEIIEAAEGQQAVNKSLETRPDVILLDLAMPVKDGFAAAREISQLLPGTPILMCTMHSSPQVEIEAQKSGIRQVLSKSNSSLILPAIRQLLTPPETPIPDAALAPLPIVAPHAVLAETIAAPTSSLEPAVEAAESPATPPKNLD